MHLCTIATVTVHICMATVAFAYHILVFFFSLSPSLLLSIPSDSHLFRFLNQIRAAKYTLSSFFLSSHSFSFHNCQSPPISRRQSTSHHYRRSTSNHTSPDQIDADHCPLTLRFSHLIKIKPLPPINSLIKIKPLLHEA